MGAKSIKVLCQLTIFWGCSLESGMGCVRVSLERGDRTEEGSPGETGEVAMTTPLPIPTPLHWTILSREKNLLYTKHSTTEPTSSTPAIVPRTPGRVPIHLITP